LQPVDRRWVAEPRVRQLRHVPQTAHYVPDTSYLRVASDQAYTGGVVVLDVSDPARPKQTARLTTPAAVEPTESMRVNARRVCSPWTRTA